MAKKFKLSASENRTMHKTIPGTDTKKKLKQKASGCKESVKSAATFLLSL